MPATLTRTRSVLHQVEFNDDTGQWFRSADEETSAIERRVYVDHNTWDDLGRPNVVTVSIEPGDTLN